MKFAFPIGMIISILGLTAAMVFSVMLMLNLI